MALSLHFFSWDGHLCTNWLSRADHSKRRESRSCPFCHFTLCFISHCRLCFCPRGLGGADALFTYFFVSLSSSAASLAVRAPRSTRSVRCQGLKSRLPTPWRAPLTDRSPSPAPMPVSAWLSTWSMPGKRLCATATHPQSSRRITLCMTFLNNLVCRLQEF